MAGILVTDNWATNLNPPPKTFGSNSGSTKSKPKANTGLARSTSRFSKPLMAMSGPGSRNVQSLLVMPATPRVPMNASKPEAEVNVTLPTAVGAKPIFPRFGSAPVALDAPVAARNAA